MRKTEMRRRRKARGKALPSAKRIVAEGQAQRSPKVMERPRSSPEGHSPTQAHKVRAAARPNYYELARQTDEQNSSDSH
jgi:hypothetical protein